MKIKLITVLLIVSVAAQAQELDKIKSAMAKLAILEGQWQGTGWIQQGNSRSEFSQTEDVQSKLDGTTLLIEGKGYENDMLKFNAMAIASFDPIADKYRFHSFLNDGRFTAAEGWFDDENVFHWQFAVPSRGTVRYTIVLTEESWQEKGAFNPVNTEQWYPFMEMNLTKID